jgi:N-acetylated-alpha-linked acidic dipeptidase
MWQRVAEGSSPTMNDKLVSVERALLLRGGLPGRTWYRHVVYAPGQFSGYSAETLPGVSEALSRSNIPLVRQQFAALAEALNRAADLLEDAAATPTFLARNHR